MDERERQRIVASEAAIEKNYGEQLKERNQSANRSLAASIPNSWTASNERFSSPRVEIVGRVALQQPNTDYLENERDFYIGTTHHRGDGFQVFSWAAPVSCTFFRRSDNHHPLCDEVAGIRVFARSAGRISDFEDVPISGQKTIDMFPAGKLVIRTAPGGSFLSQPPDETTDFPNTIDSTGERTSVTERLSSPGDPLPKPVVRETLEPSEKLPETPSTIRAPSLLRRELSKPKSVSMSAVLSTLQPDQYEVISRPASESQFLQGHPGTGKTIIAVHRVAYLLNPAVPADHKPPRGHPVLLLGPTEEYVHHVRRALARLIDDSEKYVVQSISSLLDDLAELPPSSAPTESVQLQNVDQELARLIDDAIEVTKENLGKGEKPGPEDVYQQLLWFTEEPPSRGIQKEWFLYLKKLPGTLGELRKQQSREHRGLLAYLRVRTQWPPDPGHVIVDEAQDIHPIEWEVLGRIGNRGGWTILGDLNQRRTDHTFGSWNEVARLLAIEDENNEAPVRVLENGYRSTAQIIRFANQLLPARSRVLYSLQQDGEEPTIRKANSGSAVAELSIDEALVLTDKAVGGTVAIITMDTHEVINRLRLLAWSIQPGDLSVWTKDEKSLRILEPRRARGLEFDGVVVVEPASFPENFGRLGVLYTALTRANRFLTVVHSRALPPALRTRK